MTRVRGVMLPHIAHCWCCLHQSGMDNTAKWYSRTCPYKKSCHFGRCHFGRSRPFFPCGKWLRCTKSFERGTWSWWKGGFHSYIFWRGSLPLFSYSSWNPIVSNPLFDPFSGRVCMLRHTWSNRPPCRYLLLGTLPCPSFHIWFWP